MADAERKWCDWRVPMRIGAESFKSRGCANYAAWEGVGYDFRVCGSHRPGAERIGIPVRKI